MPAGNVADRAISSDELQDAAMLAHARTDYDTALDIWTQMRMQPQPVAAAFLGTIRTLKAADREAHIAPILQEGCEKFPKEGRALARAASEMAWEAQDEQWRSVIRSARPGSRATLTAALAPLKRNVRPSPMPLVLARLEIVKERFPRYPLAHLSQIMLVRKAGKYDRALVLAQEGRRLFPNNVKLALAHAAIITSLQRYEEAHELITALRASADAADTIEAAFVHSLSQLGRLDEAEMAGAQAMARFPDSPDLAIEYAALASRRAEWSECLTRLQAARAKWPKDGKIRKRLNALLQQMPELEVTIPRAEQDEAGAVFDQFESLGGSPVGCELGVVQKTFGSTAFGLLRWTTISVDPLIEGLRNGFAGLDDLDNIRIKTYRATGDREEYMIEDERYGFNSHTFIAVEDAPAEKLLVQTAKRLGFLRRKLIEDLREGAKIFVYRSAAPMSYETMHEIFSAVRSHGDGDLVCVIRADRENAAGSIQQLQDGLFVAYMKYFMWEPPPPGGPAIDRSTWWSICARIGAVINARRSYGLVPLRHAA